jgi:hypothetical protein
MSDTPRQSASHLDADVDTALPSIEQQIAAMEIECKFRQVKVRQAARMKDVAQLAQVDIRGDLMTRMSEIRGLKQLQLACESRMRELIGGHMLELRNIRDLGLFVQMRSHYQNREWLYLKASYPMLFREADGEAERIERNLKRQLELDSQRRRGR